MKILIVTDAWDPQVNGVVRTLKMTRRELERRGHIVEIISPLGFRSIPCPTYPEISLAITRERELARRIDSISPDCLHIATEGPLGWLAREAVFRPISYFASSTEVTRSVMGYREPYDFRQPE